MTDELKLDIDTSEIEALLQRFPQFERLIAAEIEATMDSSLEVLGEQVTGRTPVNTGALRGSITPIVRGSSPQLEGILGTSLVYGFSVEYGHPPGQPPPADQIELWVRRKLGLSGSEARSTAFLIARAIGEFGTDGAFMFSLGFEAGREPVMKLWRDLPGEAIRKIEKKL